VNDPWPDIPFTAWQDTQATLHRWTQIVGKVRMVQSPWVNHGWHVPLYVTARGLGTSLIPHGSRGFSIDFDFLSHELQIRVSDGSQGTLSLGARSVARFYAELMQALDDLSLPVRIHTLPNEIPDAVPFDQDQTHASYDRDAVQRFWRALVQIERVFQRFRAGFAGKCSPVHFFWGSFDLAVTRFSGRPAPPHPGGVPHFPDWAAREAYSHEVSSAGFWPGGGGLDHAAFYSYAYPAPDGFADAAVEPDEAFYSRDLGEFVLPYDAVRSAADPDATLLAFLETTYAAAADAAQWDRAALDYEPPPERSRAAGG
jgi:hypothetical protein